MFVQAWGDACVVGELRVLKEVFSDVRDASTIYEGIIVASEEGQNEIVSYLLHDRLGVRRLTRSAVNALSEAIQGFIQARDYRNGDHAEIIDMLEGFVEKNQELLGTVP